MAADSPASCLLSDPEVGIITENDHKVGTCLCSLCTCGKHTCPRRRVNAYRVLETTYESDYHQHKSQPVRKCGPFLPYVGSQARMEVRTSMQSDYQPPKWRDRNHVAFRTRSVSPSLKFVSSTSYTKDYPDWGASPVAHEKRPNLPTRLLELRFCGESTYKKAFVGSSLNTRSFDDQKPHHRSSSLFSGVQYLRDSTHRMSYKHLDDTQKWNEVVGRPRDESVRLETPACHHLTTNSAHFRPVSLSDKDPVVLRRKKPRAKLGAL